MALGDTVESMKSLLAELTRDLEKGFSGNKAAAQRVRVNSIKFEKISKTFRKESLENEKSFGKKHLS